MYVCVCVYIVSQEYYPPKGSFTVISLGSIFNRVKKGVKHFSLL